MKRFKIVGLCLMAAFALSAVVASSASAAGEYGTCLAGSPVNKPPCGAGEHFTPFASPEMVASHGLTEFTLENTEKRGIKCGLLLDLGTFENVGGVGKSDDTLTFQNCTPIEELGTGCTEINPPKHEIVGLVLDEVLSETKAEVKIDAGTPTPFDVKCLVGGSLVDLGGVKGAAKGKVEGDKLVFTKAEGLMFFGKASTITGTNLTETLSGMPVFVN